MKIVIGLALCIVAATQAQHNIPFASQNNAIELSISNSAAIDAENVTVEINNPPSWLTFSKTKTDLSAVVPQSGTKVEIPKLKSNESSTADFTFSVDKSAPINKPYTLKFTISSPSGERWTKEISIQVSAPEKFELYQNYPNPFNPATVISYQISANSRITLKVFDVVGREVATLFEGMKEAGYHQHVWNASTVATGMYIYQLAYKNEKGEIEFYRKKMSLIK